MQDTTDPRPDHNILLNGQKQPDSITAATVYIIFAGFSALLVSMCFSPNDSIITILIAVFLMMTLGFRFWWVALLLLMVQVGLFLAEPGSVSGYSNSPGSSLVSIGVLVLLISCSRYLTLTSSPAPFRLSNRLSARVAYLHATREPRIKFAKFGVVSRDDSTVGSGELFTMLARTVIPVVAISGILQLVPLDPDTPTIARLIPPAVRTITLGIIFLAIYVLANSFLNIFIWRRHAPSEARVFIRSELSKWIHREVSQVSRRRIRLRNSSRH